MMIVYELLNNLRQLFLEKNGNNVNFMLGKDTDCGYLKSEVLINNQCIVLIKKSNNNMFGDLYINIYLITKKSTDEALQE